MAELADVHDALRAALDQGHLDVRPAVVFEIAASLREWHAAVATLDGLR